MNAIVVVNINNVLHEFSRNSMVSASKRWNCEFVEIDKPIANVKHPAYLKLWIPLGEYDKVLLVDADTIITPKCPNIFELHNAPAAVNGIPKTLVNYETLVKECKEELAEFNMQLSDLKFYFNSGVVLLDKSCEMAMFTATLLYHTYEKIKDFHWWDQTFFNVAFSTKDLTELPEEWNFIPQGRDVSNAYIIHLAGTTNRDELITEYFNQFYK